MRSHPGLAPGKLSAVLEEITHTSSHVGERIEARRYAAVLVLRELTRSAPALIYDNVPDLLDNLWTALRDPKVCNCETGHLPTSTLQADLVVSCRWRSEKQPPALWRDVFSS